MAGSLPKTAASDADRKKKGAVAEAMRQGKPHMDTVLEARSAGNAEPAETAAFHRTSEHRKLAIWIDSMVEKAKTTGKPVVQIVSLTPDLARVLLERNPHNRKINGRAVENYAHEIAGNRWAFNGEPLIISDSGDINDGQHRCEAVVLAGKPIQVIMIFGIKRETRTTLDQGRNRTTGDYLAMDGHSNHLVLAATAGMVWMYRNRGRIYDGGNSKFFATRGEVMETVAANPGIEASVHYTRRKEASAVGGPGLLAFCHFVLRAQNREDADFFIAALMTGAGLKAGDPILYVRNRLITERRSLRRNDKAELIFKGWNAWRRREKPQRLMLTGDILPVLEG